MQSRPCYPKVELTRTLDEGKMFRVRSYGHKYDAYMETLPKQGRRIGSSELCRSRNVVVTQTVGSDPARARTASADRYAQVI